VIFPDDTGAARHEGDQPDDDPPTAERFLTVHEIAEKLKIPADAAYALINAAAKAN
jgi:hypothetical protein